MIENYFEASVIPPVAYLSSSLFAVTISIIVFLFCLLAITWLKPQHSYFYRKYLANLYVASRIRQRAETEKLDLNAEEARFSVYCRKGKIKPRKELDDKILEQLNAEIDKEIESIENEPEKAKKETKKN